RQEPGYLTPEAAGFRQCVLIYDRPERSADDLLPYVSRWIDGAPRAWNFDAFLFLIQASHRGVRTEIGETQREDWAYHLDRWFAPGRDLAALDEALHRAAAVLGEPPAPRAVILSIPYPHPAVRDFGDVDGDGRSEDLSTAAGRDAVLRWYLGEARARFRAAGYRRLRLWGFYWMREDVPATEQHLPQEAARLVRAGGERFLWIPWFRAPGYDRWREMGFDAAILQPNYAFHSWHHHGTVRANRLSLAAELARRHGMGIEIEAGSVDTSLPDRRAFVQYLAMGGRSALGYQQGASAHFLGVDTVERLARSADPALRNLYALLCDYVAGDAVTDPDISLEWRTRRHGGVTEAVALMPAVGGGGEPAVPGLLDVFLDEPDPQRAWRGHVTVEVRIAGSRAWTPAGWALRGAPDASAGRWQVVTVPVGKAGEALRVRLTDAPGSPRPTVSSYSPDFWDVGAANNHLARGRPYRFSRTAQAAYGDSGRELTDGSLAPGGFGSGETVGWHGQPVAVLFDLGRPMLVERVEAHCSGGGYAAVNWPASAVVTFARHQPPPDALAGRGALPDGFAWSGGSPAVETFRRGPTDLDGRIDFRPERPLRARWVNLLFAPNAWLMLSEVRIVSGGRNVAPDATYTLAPLPTAPETGAVRYADDGRKLTDGLTADTFMPGRLVGFQQETDATATVDLGTEMEVRTVRVHALAGGLYGIRAPAGATVELSADGERWSPPVEAERPVVTEDGARAEQYILAAALRPGSRARHVRVQLRRAGGWAMLSEIEVR
ncbi:MAG TPA: DUF4855 domain-containing protein, partial [Chthonomonadales bacterium]|nr:DUF4855 domain-containing protein [Chthonomonadales bacterium]